MLPHHFVFAFASVIIVVECCSGICLLLGGKFVRIGCVAAITLMGFLMFGSAMIENWAAVMNQVVLVIIPYLLLTNKHTYDPVSPKQ